MNEKIDKTIEESWIAAGTYVLTDRGLFPFSVLKAEEKKKDRARSKQLKEEAEYLELHGLIPIPFEAANLLTLKDNCSYFDACVKQIAKDVIGQGWRLELREGEKESEKEKETILEFIENSGGDRDETFEDTLERGIIDWGIVGAWGWELGRADSGKGKGLVNGMWHIPAHTLRIHRSREKYCQIRNDKRVWFKRFGLEQDINMDTGKEEGAEGERRANELIYYRNYYPQSDYYGAPNILSSIGAVMGLIGVRDYNLAFFENYGIPAALVILKGRWSKETAKLISDFIDVEIKGSDNQHKTLVIHPGKDAEFEYIRLGVEVKEGSFKLYQKSLRDEVLVAYKMPPYRIGVAEIGALGGTTAPESTKIYASSVVTPLETIVENLVNQKIIREGLGCEAYKFELNELDLRDLDAESRRDLAYFSMAALTPNQILQSQGKDPYPEGNQYFIATTYVPLGEEPVEKSAGLLEALKTAAKENPAFAAELKKLAIEEGKNNANHRKA